MQRLAILIVIPLLATCGKPAPMSSVTTASGGVEKTRVQVEDPNNPGEDLVLVDWLRLTGTGPADTAANLWLGEVAKSRGIPLTPTDGEAFARPAGKVEDAVKRQARLALRDVGADRSTRRTLECNRHCSMAAEVERRDGKVLAVTVEGFMQGRPPLFSGIAVNARTGAAFDIDEWAAKTPRFADLLDQAILAQLADVPGRTLADKHVELDAAGHVETPSCPAALTKEGVKARVDVGMGSEGREMDVVVPYSELRGVLPDEWMPPEKK